jgi:Zn ribbon nucleic-acid-binding protein
MRNRTAYTEGNNSTSPIKGDNGKKYCPNDSRLLIYRSDIQRLFCVDCGYTPEETDQDLSASNHNNRAVGNNDIWIIPMTQPRSEQTRQRLRMQSHQGWDRDMQRMQDAGYTIKDSKEIVNDAGTYLYINNTTGIRK